MLPVFLTGSKVVLDTDSENLRIMTERMKREGLFIEWPENPKCKWVVVDEVGDTYCAHPRNAPVYFRHMGRRASICSVTSCPVSAPFPHRGLELQFGLSGSRSLSQVQQRQRWVPIYRTQVSLSKSGKLLPGLNPGRNHPQVDPAIQSSCHAESNHMILGAFYMFALMP